MKGMPRETWNIGVVSMMMMIIPNCLGIFDLASHPPATDPISAIVGCLLSASPFLLFLVGVLLTRTEKTIAKRAKFGGRVSG